MMSDSQFMVKHVRLTTRKPFAEVASAFEAGLGRYESRPIEQLAEGGSAEQVRAALERQVGPSGFVLFGSNDHGALLALVGPRRHAVQYVVGNPLYAVEMTRYAIGAALYAPLRVLIYQEDGGTSVEYDLPSSLFGQFGDERVNLMAVSLDQNLAALVAKATG
jgi:uncharacterized protein (DUF302 family)